MTIIKFTYYLFDFFFFFRFCAHIGGKGGAAVPVAALLVVIVVCSDLLDVVSRPELVLDEGGELPGLGDQPGPIKEIIICPPAYKRGTYRNYTPVVWSINLL